VSGLAGVVSAAAVVFFAHTGFEALANLGEETRSSRKDLRVGILSALGVCAVLYIAVSLTVSPRGSPSGC
jgi:basic amino acid/polyamine antiporter, APA family